MSNDGKDLMNEIGRHCSFKACNMMDYLPIKCDLCRMFYCKEHCSLTNHNCPKYDSNTLTDLTDKEKTQLPPVNFYECSFNDCNQKEIVHVVCDYCKNNFCMKHRLQLDHECQPFKKQQDEAAAASEAAKANKQTKEFKFELKQNVSEKNSALANKLIIMKLRQTAVGPAGLPELAKYYCFVQYNQNKNPFFFSNKWPIGKCVEFVFDKLSIDKASLNKIKLFLNEILVDYSLTVEKYVSDNSLNPGVIFDLKNV
jgi:predicted nucleic acid binding AN1-type Zn finger protein